MLRCPRECTKPGSRRLSGKEPPRGRVPGPREKTQAADPKLAGG